MPKESMPNESFLSTKAVEVSVTSTAASVSVMSFLGRNVRLGLNPDCIMVCDALR